MPRNDVSTPAMRAVSSCGVDTSSASAASTAASRDESVGVADVNCEGPRTVAVATVCGFPVALVADEQALSARIPPMDAARLSNSSRCPFDVRDASRKARGDFGNRPCTLIFGNMVKHVGYDG